MTYAPRFLCAAASLLLLVGCRFGDVSAQPDPYVSGGPLSQEQASYDVSFYDLNLRIDPADSTIAGAVACSRTCSTSSGSAAVTSSMLRE